MAFIAAWAFLLVGSFGVGANFGANWGWFAWCTGAFFVCCMDAIADAIKERR